MIREISCLFYSLSFILPKIETTACLFLVIITFVLFVTEKELKLGSEH